METTTKSNFDFEVNFPSESEDDSQGSNLDEKQLDKIVQRHLKKIVTYKQSYSKPKNVFSILVIIVITFIYSGIIVIYFALGF